MDKFEFHSKYDKFSLLLIVLALIVFTIESIPVLQSYERLFQALEFFFVLMFSLEYGFRIYQSKEKLKFIRSFYGIIDLLSILPFYLSFGFADLRWIRALRVVRVFRIFKLGRYVKAMDRLKLATSRVKEEILVFLMISIILIYFSAVGVYFLERDAQPEIFSSIPHALWFAAVTLTTVGYGDVTPVTAGGKFFTTIIVLLGLGLISIPSGILAGSFSEVFKEERREKMDSNRSERS